MIHLNIDISDEQFLLMRSTLLDKCSSGIDAKYMLKLQNLINLLDNSYIMRENK